LRKEVEELGLGTVPYTKKHGHKVKFDSNEARKILDEKEH